MAPFNMEEISSGLSLPTKQHSSRASPPGGSPAAPDTTLHQSSSVPEDSSPDKLGVNVGLQNNLSTFERPSEALSEPVELYFGELDGGRHLDLDPAKVLFDELLVAVEHLLQDPLAPIVH